MSTALVLSNGSLLINIGDQLETKDLYFPNIGQENHLQKTKNYMFCIINDQMFPFTHKFWDFNIDYHKDNLIGNSTITNKKHKLGIEFTDFVVIDKLIYIKEFKLINNSDSLLKVRLFFQNNFSLYENNIGDTAMWYKPLELMIHYKKNRYIAFGTLDDFYQYTFAAKSDNKNKGAYPDSTGELKFNPICTGNVSSCMSFDFILNKGQIINKSIFILCGLNIDDIENNLSYLKQNTIGYIQNKTIKHWDSYLNTDKLKEIFNKNICLSDKVLNDKAFHLFKKSLLILTTHIDNNGGIIASTDGEYLKTGGFDSYAYFWPRDAAHSASVLIKLGYTNFFEKYLNYLEKVINPKGYLLHKYYPRVDNYNNAIASSWHPWVDENDNLQLPIQEDATALTLIAIKEYFIKNPNYPLLARYWDSLIMPMIQFLINYRYHDELEVENNEFYRKFHSSNLPKPSYDIWEQYRGMMTYTVSVVYQGLLAAHALCNLNQQQKSAEKILLFSRKLKQGFLDHLYDLKINTFIKGFYYDEGNKVFVRDTSIDSSMNAVWQYGVLPVNDEKVQNLVKRIEEKLYVNTMIGGIARFENDDYLRFDKKIVGNPWFICTLWLSQYYTMIKDYPKAFNYLRWAIEHSDESGLIAEQADPITGYSLSVKPLTWSHSEYIKTVLGFINL